MANKTSSQEGIIYLMVIMSAADREMSDLELAKMGRLTRYLPVFEDFEEEDLLPTTRRCSALLAEPEGLGLALRAIKEAIPERLYDTAYAIAVDLASADMNVRIEEIRVLQLVRDLFNLDKLTCAAIERGAIARFRKARSSERD